MIFRTFHSTFRAASAVLAAALVAGCADAPLVPPPSTPPPVPAGALAVLACRVDVAARSLACQDAAGGGVAANRVIGGQNVNVRLTSTNVAYDPATQRLGADVTVQNLLVQRMGTPDGTSVDGIRVFFHTAPVATSGTGTVSVANPDGVGLFTGSAQPYFHYPVVLPLDSISPARRWEFALPATVGTFQFHVYVWTPLLPVVVFDRVVDGNRDIWRVALDGSDLVRVTTHPGDDQLPTVARGRVVFTSYRGGTADLYAVPLTGGAETQLTSTTSNLVQPALSPDGERLAFANDVLGVHKLWSAAGDGTGRARLTSTSFGHSGAPEGAPSWSPDGTRVAFMSTASGSADIYAMEPGGTPYLVAGGPQAEVEPAWSPDGGRVAFASNRSGSTEIYVVDLASGVVTRLTNRAGSDGGPTWLSDGRIVYVQYDGSAGSLRWLDPAVPFVTHAIPTGTGSARNPAAVRF